MQRSPAHFRWTAPRPGRSDQRGFPEGLQGEGAEGVHAPMTSLDGLLEAAEELEEGVLPEDDIHPGVDDLVDAGQPHADQVLPAVPLPRHLVGQDVHLYGTDKGWRMY